MILKPLAQAPDECLTKSGRRIKAFDIIEIEYLYNWLLFQVEREKTLAEGFYEKTDDSQAQGYFLACEDIIRFIKQAFPCFDKETKKSEEK